MSCFTLKDITLTSLCNFLTDLLQIVGHDHVISLLPNNLIKGNTFKQFFLFFLVSFFGTTYLSNANAFQMWYSLQIENGPIFIWKLSGKSNFQLKIFAFCFYSHFIQRISLFWKWDFTLNNNKSKTITEMD